MRKNDVPGLVLHCCRHFDHVMQCMIDWGLPLVARTPKKESAMDLCCSSVLIWMVHRVSSESSLRGKITSVPNKQYSSTKTNLIWTSLSIVCS
jgi:hypothetical protein